MRKRITTAIWGRSPLQDAAQAFAVTVWHQRWVPARTHWLQDSQAIQSVAVSSPPPQMAHTASRWTSSGCA
jgi:hypothetical protein